VNAIFCRIPLIWVRTVTVASGVTVPSAGMRTWISPMLAVATRHRNRGILAAARLGGRVERRLLLVLQMAHEQDHENEDNRERNQDDPAIEEFFA
jgi:hypothetical protein